MTVIIALKDKENNRVILGADKQGTNGWDMKGEFNDKIIQIRIPYQIKDNTYIEDLFILVSGNGFLHTYLTEAFEPPVMSSEQTFLNYMYNNFIPSIIEFLEVNHMMEINNNVNNTEGAFILLFRNELYGLYSDFSCVKSSNDFLCFGSGIEIATGVLTNLLTYHKELDKVEMVKQAIHTTSKINVYCGMGSDITIVEYKERD